uniref:AD domain-containing protein n=1 Tax=Setaria digitata TaxID=48799 RepID=A0A915PL91_9BILA
MKCHHVHRVFAWLFFQHFTVGVLWNQTEVEKNRVTDSKMDEACISSVLDMSISTMYHLCGEPIAVDLVNNKTVIPGQSIKYLRKFDDDNELPDGCIKKTPELESWLGKLLRVAPQSSKQQILERRKKLIEWLEQNQIQVKSNGDGSITLFDAVRIVSPFTAEDWMSKLVEDEDLEILYNENNVTTVVGTEQDGGGSIHDQMVMVGELSAEDRDFSEKFLDSSQGDAVDEEHNDNKGDSNGIVEDALERTINEVAETSLQSAAVEGEDLTNEDSKKKSKYDWDAPIVKDIVRRVKNHRLSHAKAAEQLSLLMDAKVTSIGVRLQVVKMANDEALAKQDQRSGCAKAFKNNSSSPSKGGSRASDTSVRSRENRSPVSYRTRSKTGVKQNIDGSQISKSEGGIEVHGAASNMGETSSQCAGNTTSGISLPVTTVQSDAVNNQLYLPIVISQPASAAAATKMVPPVIRLLDNEGKLTHIAVAENGSYKLYRVNEGGTNAEHMQMVNQAVSAGDSKFVTGIESSASSLTTSETHGISKHEKSVVPSCSANYYIESVPAQQTLGALVGIPKFVNPQRYGGSNVYTRTFGPVGTPGIVPRSGCSRSRNEIKEEVKRLIHCVKSQHITCDEAVKQLFQYAALSSSNVVVPVAKADTALALISEVLRRLCVDYETPLQRESNEVGNEQYTRLVDEQGNMNIAIMEGEGYRVYRLNKTAENRELYKCADCDLLHRTKKDPIAMVEIADGILYGDFHPTHHPKCPLQTLSVKECDQNSMSDERESLLIHEATTDVEESRKGSGVRKNSAKRTPKQNSRKNQQMVKSPIRKRPSVIPERSLGMTLRKRKTRTLTSPGIYDSEVMS